MQRKRASRFFNRKKRDFWQTASTESYLKENFSDEFEIGTLKEKLAGRPRMKGAENLTDTQLLQQVQTISRNKSLHVMEARVLDLALKAEAEGIIIAPVLREGLRTIVVRYRQ